MWTDETLAAQAAAGDAAAFQSLAQRYIKPAFSYAYHFLSGYDDAQDAVQEALIQVYLALPTRTQRAWCHRAATG